MKNISAKWQKLIIWLTGYLNLIAFVIAGGYIYINSDDDDIRNSAKTVLFLSAFFAGLNIILNNVLYSILSLFNANLNVLSKIILIVGIIEAIVFIVLFILDFIGIKVSFVSIVANEDKAEKAKLTLPEDSEEKKDSDN